MRDVIIEVKELRQSCPVFKVGDTIFVKVLPEGAWAIDTQRSSAKFICFSALPSLVGESIKVRHSVQDRVCVACLDPGYPYTKNSVVFEIKPA
jgi:hypothetical protein